jgi:hypothetical protein
MQLRYKLSVVGEHGALEVVRADCLSSDDRYILRFKPSPNSPTQTTGMAAYSISGLKNQFEAFLSLAKAHRDDKERLEREQQEREERHARVVAERAQRAAAAAAAAAEQRRRRLAQQERERGHRSHRESRRHRSHSRHTPHLASTEALPTQHPHSIPRDSSSRLISISNDCTLACATAPLVDTRHHRSHACDTQGASSDDSGETAHTHVDEAYNNAAVGNESRAVMPAQDAHGFSRTGAKQEAAQRVATGDVDMREQSGSANSQQILGAASLPSLHASC